MQSTCKKRSLVKKGCETWQHSMTSVLLIDSNKVYAVDFSEQKYSITMTSCCSHPSCPKIIRNIELRQDVTKLALVSWTLLIEYK